VVDTGGHCTFGLEPQDAHPGGTGKVTRASGRHLAHTG
jgi:hypothetical protein